MNPSLDDGAPSRAGLRIGSRRISELPFLVLFRGFCLYGSLCLLILYGGALGVGHSRGFAYLAATEVGEVFGDVLTAEKSRVDATLRHLEVFDLRTYTNRDQRVVHTTIKRVGLRWNYDRLTDVELDGFTCDVTAQRKGGWTPSRLDFLGRLPLVNPLVAQVNPAPAPAGELKPDEPDGPAAPQPGKKFDFRNLPPIRLRDATLRLKNTEGVILAEFTGVNLRWVPAAAAPDGRDRLELQASYLLPARKLQIQKLDIVVSAKDGKYVFDKLEAEQALILEAGRFLEELTLPHHAPPPPAPPANRGLSPREAGPDRQGPPGGDSAVPT